MDSSAAGARVAWESEACSRVGLGARWEIEVQEKFKKNDKIGRVDDGGNVRCKGEGTYLVSALLRLVQ